MVDFVFAAGPCSYWWSISFLPLVLARIDGRFRCCHWSLLMLMVDFVFVTGPCAYWWSISFVALVLAHIDWSISFLPQVLAHIDGRFPFCNWTLLHALGSPPLSLQKGAQTTQFEDAIMKLLPPPFFSLVLAHIDGRFRFCHWSLPILTIDFAFVTGPCSY